LDPKVRYVNEAAHQAAFAMAIVRITGFSGEHWAWSGPEVAKARFKPFSNPEREVQPQPHAGGSGSKRIELHSHGLSPLVFHADLTSQSDGM
jgi:hypothetical protein